MTSLLPLLFGLMLLLDPGETINAEAAAAVSDDADRYNVKAVEKDRELRIRSVTADVDRANGVVLFEGNVRVDYSDEYTMCADQLYAFLSVSNDLRRIVAVGHVTITNDTRSGTCATAVYRRLRREIEMFGDGGATLARLADAGDEENAPSEIEGGRIKFWLDSEQVEVEDSRLKIEGSKGKEMAL